MVGFMSHPLEEWEHLSVHILSRHWLVEKKNACWFCLMFSFFGCPFVHRFLPPDRQERALQANLSVIYHVCVN